MARKCLKLLGGSTGTRTLDLRVKSPATSTCDSNGLDPLGGHSGANLAAGLAGQLVRRTARREVIESDLLIAFVRAVLLEQPIVRQALAVLEGGDHALDRALDLAVTVLTGDPVDAAKNAPEVPRVG